MIKLNDNNIFVAEIKQLLKDFNLPQCPVGSENALENNHYIEDFGIYLTKNGKSKKIITYNYGEKYLNLTSNFKIDNLLYDRATHRYLGKYLRFLRDYKKIDLMSMYNCFDGEAFNEVFSVEGINFGDDISSTITYKIPITKAALTIKLFGSYLTNICVYVDSAEYFEVETAGSTDKTKIFYRQKIAEETLVNKRTDQLIDYKGVSELISLDNNYKDFLKRNADKLYLLMKVNRVDNHSIVVIEGSDFIDNDVAAENLFTSGADETPDRMIKKFKVYPQLLSLRNATGNYLLADRLVEYLTTNAIGPLSELADINRIHDIFEKNPEDYPFNENKYYGYWVDSDSKNIKYLIFKNIDKINNRYDLLGYVDKDVEYLIREAVDNGKIE